MKPTPKDPANKLLKAYQNILDGSIVYGGKVVYVGTRIPRGESEYVLLYIDDISPMDTGDAVIYNIIMAMQIVSMQETTEGNEEVVNDILEQVLELVGSPEMFIMNGFKCVTSNFEGSERLPESTDANYIITRKLQMSNIIEQS